MVLGMRTLRLLSLSFSVMDTQSDSDFNYDAFWRNSLATAIACKLLGKRSGGNGDEDFLIGLVFNVGQIGIGNTYPDKISEMLGEDQSLDELTVAMERDAFGTDRYEIGGMLLEKWHFPEQMVDTLRGFAPENLSDQAKPMYVSQLLGSLLLATDIDEAQIRETKQQASALLEIDNDQFDALFDEMVDEWKGYESLFNYDAIQFNSIQELELRAKESMIQISLGMETEIRQMTEEKKELEESALIDSLTKLKNRTAYDSEVPGFVDYHSRQKKSFGLVVIDIDHFKKVNDTYGHAAGDSVLRAVGESLQAKCRNYDTVYRYGGEEFVAVVMDCDFESLTIVSNRFREAVEGLNIATDSGELKVTASLGACWSEDGVCNSMKELFSQADSFLYEAKESGRNRCVINKFADAELVS